MNKQGHSFGRITYMCVVLKHYTLQKIGWQSFEDRWELVELRTSEELVNGKTSSVVN